MRHNMFNNAFRGSMWKGVIESLLNSRIGRYVHDAVPQYNGWLSNGKTTNTTVPYHNMSSSQLTRQFQILICHLLERARGVRLRGFVIRVSVGACRARFKHQLRGRRRNRRRRQGERRNYDVWPREFPCAGRAVRCE